MVKTLTFQPLSFLIRVRRFGGYRKPPTSMAGTIRKKQLTNKEQFQAVDDQKLRMTLIAISDKLSEQARQIVYATYNNNELSLMYRNIRRSGMYAKGSLDGASKKIIEFPNGYVLDFINTVMTEMYGPNWMDNNKALRHDLIRPWWVVEKI